MLSFKIMNFIADTHALLWWFTDNPKISSRASEIFEDCEKGENVIFIPSIVIAEALSIFDKKRVAFNFKSLIKKIQASDNFSIIPLDYPILEKMFELKEIPELHDKIIASTGKYLKAPIITKDKALQNIRAIKTIW
jgi:PIN domain nuclease of toxin-antitoxin system